MSLTEWRTFLAACRLGSLSAAAAELGYTQSAVSRQLAALEREVGAPLVARHARGVRPTAAGEAFRHHAQAAVNEAERAIRAAREAAGESPARPLAVGAAPSLAAGVVPAAVRRLLDAAGPLPWTLVPGLTRELYERMATGELDMAVVTDAPPGLPSDPRLERQLLGVDEMIVVLPAGHPLAGGERVRIEVLAGEAWVEDNEGSAALLRQHAARAGVTARIDLNAADLSGKVALVAAGHAIALVPGVLATALRADVTTVALVSPPTRGIYAVLPRDDPHPAAPLLLRELMASFRLPWSAASRVSCLLCQLGEEGDDGGEEVVGPVLVDNAAVWRGARRPRSARAAGWSSAQRTAWPPCRPSSDRQARTGQGRGDRRTAARHRASPRTSKPRCAGCGRAVLPL